MKMSSNISRGFIRDLLRLADMAVEAEGDTVEFTLAERDGIRMDVSISFSFTKIDDEEVKDESNNS